MKICAFELMPYRDLPADFEKRYESVWVTPPSDELCDPKQVNRYYHETLDELELAGQLGFDGICVNEHHQNAYGFMPSPNLMASTLTRRTQDVAIVVLGNTLPLYQPPIRIAEEFAMLDVLSGGRLVAGFPVGTSWDVNYAYGVTPTQTRPRFYEADKLIMEAWTRKGPFAFNGKFTQLRHVNPWPKPLQKPHPPIWLAGGGSVETWEFAVEKNYTYNFLSYAGNRFGERMLKGFWETATKMHCDENPYRAGFLQLVCVSETDAQAEKDYLEHVLYFYNKCLHLPMHYQMEAPGYRTKRTIENFIKTDQVGEIMRMATMEKSWKTFIENEFIIAGSPATVTEKLTDAIRRLRIGHLMILTQIGSMPHELTKKNITLLAKEVLPRIQGIWDGEGWQDTWWPQAARRVEQ